MFDTFTFKSTTIRSERFKNFGLDLIDEQKYPIEFKLRKSKSKISDLSDYQNQRRILDSYFNEIPRESGIA